MLYQAELVCILRGICGALKNFDPMFRGRSAKPTKVERNLKMWTRKAQSGLNISRRE